MNDSFKQNFWEGVKSIQICLKNEILTSFKILGLSLFHMKTILFTKGVDMEECSWCGLWAGGGSVRKAAFMMYRNLLFLFFKWQKS